MDKIYIHTKNGTTFTAQDIKVLGNKLRFKDLDTNTTEYIDLCHISSISIIPPKKKKEDKSI